MAKKVIQLIKLQIPAGKANPAPPVGPALGQHGLNIQDFCAQFNDKTKELGDTLIPVVISVFEDRSFTFIIKTAPASELIKKAINLKKGSGIPHKEKVPLKLLFETMFAKSVLLLLSCRLIPR